MMKHITLLVISILLMTKAVGQTPGLIYKPAGTGKAVLDPNGDGYTSITTAGFKTNDQTESEIPYKPITVPGIEPVADPQRGPDCSFTDLVDSGDEDPVLTYFDSNGNLLFRFRLGNSAPNSKGYSILIDADQKFGFTGAHADPNAVAGNAGFEIEIVLRTNFGVSLYDVDGTSNPVLKTTFAYENYAQKSVALTTNCGTPDHFYDFFIPFSAITQYFPSVTTSTPLRMVAVTSMNPAPAIGNNAVADVGGVDDQAYGYNLTNIFQAIINNFYPTDVNSFNSGFPSGRAECPVITNNLTVSSTSITGTSSESAGTIKVFKNGSLLGTTSVSNGAWSLSVSGLASGDIITATANVSGKSESVSNCNAVNVTMSCTPAVTSATACNANKAFSGTGAPGAVIKIYFGSTATPIAATSGNLFSSGSITVDNSGNWLWRCVGTGQTTSCTAGGGPCLSDGTYRITQTLSGQCESAPTFVCIGSNCGTVTAAPVITTNPILNTSTTVSGTSVSGAQIVLYANGLHIGSATASTTSPFAWTATGLTLQAGQAITARAIAGANTISALSNSVTVSALTATPVIGGEYCTNSFINQVFGSVNDVGGTVIEIFANGVSQGTATSNAFGGWFKTGLSIAPGATLTARATAPGKLQSNASAGVIIGTQSNASGLSVDGPVMEGVTSLTGMVSGSGTVKVYIDGGLLGTASVSDGMWILTGIPAFEIYAGGQVTATITTGGNCESAHVHPETIQCAEPNLDLLISPEALDGCGDLSSSVTIHDSEAGLIYQLFKANVAVSPAVFSTGGNLVLTSGMLSQSATLTIRVIRIASISCSSTLNQVHQVTIAPFFDENLLSAPTQTEFCGTAEVQAIVGSAPADGEGYTYQWQSSTNNLTFTNVEGANAKDFDAATLTEPPGSEEKLSVVIVSASAIRFR